jgi:hypothetical protein
MTPGPAAAIVHGSHERRHFGPAKLCVGDTAGEAILFVCLVPIFLAPAFWNGFPLVYYDTGAYVFEGLGGHFLVERSPVYSLFLRFGGADASLWLIVLVQSALVSFTITETMRAIVPRLSLGIAFLIGVVLLAATGLPWYVGQVEPDCFTAPVVLSLYLLVFHPRTLGRLRTALLIVVGAFAAAAHPSHLALAVFLLMLVVMLRVVLLLAAHRSVTPQLLKPAILCLGGLALVLSANYYFTRQVFVSRAGASFVFARMLQDGIVMRLLEDTCPRSGYKLCAWRDSLPATADGWLWTSHSPFNSLGHFEGTAEESAQIVRDSVLRYPLLQIRAATADMIAQFLRFRTGDQIEPQEWVLFPVLAHYLPAQTKAYLAARQQRGEIRFRMISDLDVAVGFLSLIGIAALLGWFILAQQFNAAALHGFVLAALVGNAAICGILSGPHDRYQSRLVWLAPFAVMLTVPLARRQPDQPG